MAVDRDCLCPPLLPPRASMFTLPRAHTFLLVLAVTCLGFATLADAAEPTKKIDPADALGWQLTIHSYTFQKFSIFDAIEKTRSLGVKNMSISGSVMLDD